MPRVTQIHEWGGPEVLKLQDAPKPSPNAGKAQAAGIRAKQQSVRPDGGQLREFAALIDAG